MTTMLAEARLLSLAVVLAFLCATTTGGIFTAPCVTAPCPSVRWADAAAGQTTTFVLTSSKRTSAANNWLAFAFASGQRMTDTLLVVDCYDVGGKPPTVGTSKNIPWGNEDSPANLSKLANVTARIDQGIYSCAFAMALPSQPAYVMLAEGAMDPSSSGPKKQYHGAQKWVSNAAYNFSSPAVTTPSSGAVTSVRPVSSLSNSSSPATVTISSTLPAAVSYKSTNESSAAPVTSTVNYTAMNTSVAMSETASESSTPQMFNNYSTAAPAMTSNVVEIKSDASKGKGSGADRASHSWLVAVAVLGAGSALLTFARGR